MKPKKPSGLGFFKNCRFFWTLQIKLQNLNENRSHLLATTRQRVHVFTKWRRQGEFSENFNKIQIWKLDTEPFGQWRLATIDRNTAY